MEGTEWNVDGPGESVTDLAAMSAFEAMDEKLREQGFDPDRSFQVVMVLIADGEADHATIAGHLQDNDPQTLLNHALTQLKVLADECGVRITAAKVGQN